MFLHEVMNASLSYRAGELPAQRRLHAYSAHDITLVGILGALGVFDGVAPPYSSALVLELRELERGDGLGIKVSVAKSGKLSPFGD